MTSRWPGSWIGRSTSYSIVICPATGCSSRFTPAPVHPHVVLAPEPGELLACCFHPGDEIVKRLVAGVRGPRGAQVGDALTHNPFPVHVEFAELRVRHAQPRHVPLTYRQPVEIKHQRGNLIIPGKDVEPVVNNHRREG